MEEVLLSRHAGASHDCGLGRAETRRMSDELKARAAGISDGSPPLTSNEIIVPKPLS